MNTGRKMPKLKRNPSDATQVIVAQTQTNHDHKLSRLRGAPLDQHGSKLNAISVMVTFLPWKYYVPIAKRNTSAVIKCWIVHHGLKF